MPPQCPGLERLTQSRDGAAIAWMTLGRFSRSARKSPGFAARAIYGYLWVVAVVFFPVVLLPAYTVMVRDPRRTFYALRDDRGRIQAALCITTAPGRCWVVDSHVSRRPGTGQGQRLREQLLPTLLVAADRHGVTIQAHAATPGLAQVYCATVPGLIDAGPARPFGRRLNRPALPGL